MSEVSGMGNIEHWHVHFCPEHGCQVGRTEGLWMCREGHIVPLPQAVDVVRASTYQGAVSRAEQLERAIREHRKAVEREFLAATPIRHDAVLWATLDHPGGQ